MRDLGSRGRRGAARRRVHRGAPDPRTERPGGAAAEQRRPAAGRRARRGRLRARRARTHGHRRRAWGWLAVGTGSWAAGQAVWSFYEVVLGPRGAVPLARRRRLPAVPAGRRRRAGRSGWAPRATELVARGRDVLDGAIIAGSLLVLSWVTTLGSVVAEGGDGWFPLTLSLAYPVGDLILGHPGAARAGPRRAAPSGPRWRCSPSGSAVSPSPTAPTSTWSASERTPRPT